MAAGKNIYCLKLVLKKNVIIQLSWYAITIVIGMFLWRASYTKKVIISLTEPPQCCSASQISCLSPPLQVKAIEKRDAVLTSSQQIERLLRPGSTYFNLNPYEVS